jgi:hypothetical protein
MCSRWRLTAYDVVDKDAQLFLSGPRWGGHCAAAAVVVVVVLYPDGSLWAPLEMKH